MNKKLIQLFEKIQNGDLSQIDEVYSILYNDIKAIAAYQINLVNSGETVTPTVLANECYLKLIKEKIFPAMIGAILCNICLKVCAHSCLILYGLKIVLREMACKWMHPSHSMLG